MAKTIERSDLKDGTRLLRRVLKAFPPKTDDPEDAIVRKVAEGIVEAADLAEGERPRRSHRPS